MADRDQLIRIGMGAVFMACGIFTVTRAVAQWQSGQPTPWWANALGFMVLGVVGLLYRRDPARLGSLAVHATGAVTIVALVIPVFYGMESSIWWLSLLGFAMVMLGSPREGFGWGLVVVLTVLGISLIEDAYQLPGALGESYGEVVAARVVFTVLLMGIARFFRTAAEERATALRESAEELARANAAKGRFFALMSHELRTPLHGVIAMTDLALHDELHSTARAHVSTAHTSARLLLRMLNDVLDASWDDADALNLEINTFRLHSMVGDVLRPLAQQAMERGIRFQATSEPGLAEKRRGDATRVAQIVLNLCANALKFTHEGRIGVHLSEAGAQRVRIEVDDSGRGIPEAMREAVFEPFSQVESGDAHLGGAGLGLNIVRELSRRMNGTAVCEASASGGARFVIELELEVMGPEAGAVDLLDAPTEASLPPNLEKSVPIRILAAEDDPTNQVVLRALCSRLGHPIQLVKDGVEALQALEAEDFDLLLTDIQMPRMDGYALIEHIRGLTGRPGIIPIVVCSAQLGASDLDRLQRLDIQLHLAKPFTLEGLKVVLDEVRTEPLPSA